MSDPELARALAQTQGTDARIGPDGEEIAEARPGWRPQYRAWDLHAEQLGQIVSALGSLQQAVVASAGGKGRRPDPYPTPWTALPEVEREQAADDMATTLGMLGISFDGEVFGPAGD